MGGGVDREKALRPDQSLDEREQANKQASSPMAMLDAVTGARQAQLWRQLGAEPPESAEAAASLAIDRKGAGRSVDGSLAARVGGQTGVDVSSARVHDDPLSRSASSAMGARAFAHGQDIFLGPGESANDPALLGHELTHVAQSQGGAQRVRAKVAVGEANSPLERHADEVGAAVASNEKPDHLLVDSGPLAAGQMHKDPFLVGLREAVVRVVEQELGKVGATLGCPYIDKYFGRYGSESAHVGESFLRHWLPNAKYAHSAQDLVPLVLARVRYAVRTWHTTGRLPPDLSLIDPNIAAHSAGTPAPVHKKSIEGMEAELGPGQPLDHATSAKMSRLVGADVSAARIHTGSVAASMAADHGAAAFAVGQNVVMGSRAPQSGVEADVLLAHELAHTAQQADAAKDPVARRQPIGPEDPAAEQDAGLARLGNFAGAVGDVMRTGLQLQRCQVGDVDAGPTTEHYYQSYIVQIAADAAEQLRTLPFATYDDAVTWTATGMKEFAGAMADQITEDTDLDSLVRPELIGKLVAEGRVVTQVTPPQGDAGAVSKGPGTYFPSVGTEVGNALARRTAESLQREIPRYAQARIAAGGKEPGVDDVTSGHPIDPLVLSALTRGNVVTLDTAKFKTRHPELDGPPKVLRESRDIKLSPVDGLSGWYRLEQPMDATPEEVALALTGSPTESFRLEVAHPLYGLESDTRGKFAEESDSVGRAAQLAASNNGVADEAALAQAGPISTQGARSRTRIFEQMRLNSTVLSTSVYETANALGVGGQVLRASNVIDERLSRLESAPDTEVAKWDAHAQKQADIIARGSRGLATDLVRMEAYKSTLANDTELPHDHPLNEDVAMWAQALLVSDLVASADKQLLAASNHSMTLEIEILEHSLSTPQAAAFDAADTTQTKQDFDTDAMGQREIEQRKKLGQMRAQMLADPSKLDAAVSEKTNEDTRNLVFESQVAAQASTMEHAWLALDAAVESWMTTAGDTNDARKLKTEGKAFYGRWQGIYKLIKEGEAGNKSSMKTARQQFDDLCIDPKFKSYLDRVKSELKDIHDHQLIATLFLMVAITLVSMGAGTALSGFLGGTAIAVEGTEIVVGGIGMSRNAAAVAGFIAEVSTFTFLANRAFSKDHSVGAMLSEFAKNLVMFGAMRGIGAAFKAAGLTQLVKAGEDASKLAKIAAKGGDLLGQTILNGGVGVMMAWVEQKVKEMFGAKPMTEQEAHDAVVMAVAQAVIFTIGGRLLESPLKKLEVGSALSGQRWKRALEGWNLERKANIAMQDKLKGGTAVPEEIVEAAQRDREQIAKEREALEELKEAAERDPKALKKQGIDPEVLKAQIDNLALHEQTALGVELSLSMKEIGPNHFQADRADVADVLLAQGRMGSEAHIESTDPGTGARTWLITPKAKGAKPFRITEKMPDWALTPSGKRVIEAAQRAGMNDASVFKLSSEARIKLLETDEALAKSGLDPAKLHKLEEALVAAGRSKTAVDAVGKATPDQLEQLVKMADISAQATGKLLDAVGLDALNVKMEAGPDGQVRINDELEIHPNRLDQIDPAHLKQILEATRPPVNRDTLLAFSKSGSYRLRFQFQLADNEVFLNELLDGVGRKADPAAKKILDNLDNGGRARLQDAKSTSKGIPQGVDKEVRQRATNYALDQNPQNAREFVDHFEMFISEFNNARAEARKRIEDDSEAAQANGMAEHLADREASKKEFGREVQGFKADFNREVLKGFDSERVTKRAAALQTQLAGRFGPKDIGQTVEPTNVIAGVRGMGDLQFGSKSSATYHTNKHGLPPAHEQPSYAPDEVSAYLKSANETIQTGTPGPMEYSQDGGFSLSFTKDYPRKPMRAIVKVTVSGKVVIATYGDA